MPETLPPRRSPATPLLLTTSDARQPWVARIDPPWVLDFLLVGAGLYGAMAVVGAIQGAWNMVVMGALFAAMLAGGWMHTRLPRHSPRAARAGRWLWRLALLAYVVCVVFARVLLRP